MNATSEVFQERPGVDDDPGPAARRLGAASARRILLSAAVVSVVVGFAIPRLLGTTAPSVLSALKNVSLGEIGMLACLWAAGLLTHSFVLTGALPGLSRVRALMLNLTGSAVANVLPFGGAAATTLNYTMARSWNVSVSAFAAFTLIANVWWIVVKLSLPLFALVVLSVSGGGLHSAALRAAAVVSAIALVAIGAAMTAALRGRHRRAVHAASRAFARVAARVGRPCSADAVAETVHQARGRTVAIVGARWPQLCAGMAGYACFQALLLGASLHAVGGGPSWPVVFAAYAVDRVLTLAVFAPGAAGVSELGVAAALVALGGAPTVTVAGVLLYRAFTFGIEIPIGGGWLAGWAAMRWWRRRSGAGSAGPAVAPHLRPGDV